MSKPDLSWVIPAHNEAPCLAQLVAQITSVSAGSSYEIIIVDDASTDNPPKIRSPHLRIITLPHRLGKWPALSLGLKASRGHVIITLDADLQDHPRQIIKLLPYLNNSYDLISGWRRPRRDPIYKVIISHSGNWLVSVLTGHRFHDLNSPVKVFRQKLLSSLPLAGSLFRFSLLFAHKLGVRTIEVPIRHYPRQYGHSKFGLVKYLRILYDLILIWLLFTGSGRITKTK